MNLATTFRHMEASQAVRDHAEDRLEKLRKYLHGDPIAAHATFAVERGHNHMCEIHITLPSGLVIQARETTEDMHSSIDLAGARIERQVRRWKDRIRDHKAHTGPTGAGRQRVFREDMGHLTDAATPHVAPSPKPAVPSYKISKEETFQVRPMRVDDAIMQLNLIENDFFVFLDVDSKHVSVVYRRKDANFGLIETGATLPGA